APKITIQINARLNVDDRSVLARSMDTVPNSANRVDQRIGLLAIHLAADAPHIDVDDVGVGIEVKVPDMLQQHRARHHPTLVANEIFEELELARQQLDLLATPANDARYQIHLEIAGAQNCFLDGCAAASGQRLDPRQHLDECERLDEVII